MNEPSPRLRVLVLEDEWAARNYLIELLERSARADVVGAVSDLAEAREALTASKGSSLDVDVVFVDVQLLGDGDDAGLSLIRSFAGAPEAPAFVLATASSEHALEAFELGVVDYLLKPFTQERVSQCLERVRARVRLRPSSTRVPRVPRIVARKKNGLVFLRIDEVLAFEATERLAQVHAKLGVFEIDLSLAAIEASVGRGFHRVHRNWLVNVEHVREIARDGGESTLVLSAGDGGSGGDDVHASLRVPLARDRAHAVRELLLADATGLRRS
jgi:DNA-binding LytR/AlgR family response regulator